MTVSHQHPTSAEGITPAYLNGLLADKSGPRITGVAIVEARTYGEQMVSTAGRVVVDVSYAAGAADDMPQRLVVKLARGVDEIMTPFYANEVAFYGRIRAELTIEAPRCFGAAFDPASGRFALLLEDLTTRGAIFPNVTQPTTPGQIRALLRTVSALHARFWQSPRFAGDLSWVETHVAGGVHDLMNNLAPTYIQHEIDHENFKRELVQRLRTTGDELLAGVQAVQRHQSRLPQTLLHGDTHLGNTYLLPDGSGGLLDWQLMVRGYAMHDVNYLITTGLSIADRRTHERDLLAYYLDQLASAGAAAQSFEACWLEYRRALVWGVYVGWLTTPVVNYGWEINVLNHLRLTTAFEDHETARLVAELL
jgi:Phosphotransferase enzyme family